MYVNVNVCQCHLVTLMYVIGVLSKLFTSEERSVYNNQDIGIIKELFFTKKFAITSLVSIIIRLTRI